MVSFKASMLLLRHAYDHLVWFGHSGPRWQTSWCNRLVYVQAAGREPVLIAVTPMRAIENVNCLSQL